MNNKEKPYSRPHSFMHYLVQTKVPKLIRYTERGDCVVVTCCCVYSCLKKPLNIPKKKKKVQIQSIDSQK